MQTIAREVAQRRKKLQDSNGVRKIKSEEKRENEGSLKTKHKKTKN